MKFLCNAKDARDLIHVSTTTRHGSRKMHCHGSRKLKQVTEGSNWVIVKSRKLFYTCIQSRYTLCQIVMLLARKISQKIYTWHDLIECMRNNIYIVVTVYKLNIFKAASSCIQKGCINGFLQINRLSWKKTHREEAITREGRLVNFRGQAVWCVNLIWNGKI